MNASMARRIRCAESLLIYAIDRQYGEQRERWLNPKPTRSDSRRSVGMGNGQVETRNRTRDPNPARKRTGKTL
jgi:hypothetical protein